MRQSEGSGRSRTGRIRRDKSAADSPAESLGGKRIIGLGRGHGPLHDTDMVAIHEAALAVLAKTGGNNNRPRASNVPPAATTRSTTIGEASPRPVFASTARAAS